MTATKIMTRRIADLITPSDLGENLLKFNKVILPCGLMPAGYEDVEGLTISQIGDIIIEHLDVQGLLPDLNGGGGLTSATKFLKMSYTNNPNPTIPIDDLEIGLIGSSPKTMRLSEAIQIMGDPTKENLFVALEMESDYVNFLNFDSSGAEIQIYIRLIPENQDSLQNITFSENPTFSWHEENKAYIGKLLPFPKPKINNVERQVLQNGNYNFTGDVSNMLAGTEYQVAVSSTIQETGEHQMNYFENPLNTNEPTFSNGNIPSNMFPYMVMTFVRGYVGYRDFIVMSS